MEGMKNRFTIWGKGKSPGFFRSIVRGRRWHGSIKLYLHYLAINVRCMMQYKTSFFLTVLGQFLVSFQVFLGIFFLFQRFSRVGDFSYSEVLLCFSCFLLSFSLAEMFARGFDSFSGMVRQGEFDRILVRPQSEVLQVLGSKFELTRVGKMLQAIVMFAYGVAQSGVEWNISKIVTVIFMVSGGTVLFSGLFMVYASLCFFTLEGLEFVDIFTEGAREFGRYPFAVYGKKLLLFTTFVIPYALVQYYPLLYLLGRERSVWYVFLPLLSCWFLLPCLLLWRFGVRHYKSSGS